MGMHLGLPVGQPPLRSAIYRPTASRNGHYGSDKRRRRFLQNKRRRLLFPVLPEQYPLLPVRARCRPFLVDEERESASQSAAEPKSRPQAGQMLPCSLLKKRRE